MTVMTSREFVNDIARAQEATASGPVFVTDHGQTTHVLMTAAQFDSLQSGSKTIAEALALDDEEVAAFDFPQIRGDIARPPDLS